MVWFILFFHNIQHSINGFLRNSPFLPVLPIMKNQSPLKFIFKIQGLVL